MNGLRQRVFKWVSGTHITVLFLLLVIPWMRGCFHKKPKIIATFDLGAPPPPPPETEPEPEPEPEKPKPAPKVEKPVPTSPKTNAPPKKAETNPPPKKVEAKKPAITNAPPKKAEPKKPVVTNAPAAKPKTLEERLEDVRKGGKPVPNPSAKQSPQLDFSGLKSALNSAAASPGTTYGSGSGSDKDKYLATIEPLMYRAWQQPVGAPIGLTADAIIRIERNGAVSFKSVSRRSGNIQFDLSVQKALSDTTWLPPPPASLIGGDITITFELSK